MKFQIGDQVTITLSGHKGIVAGRAEYDNAEPSYYVRHLTSEGDFTTEWITESVLVSRA